jgi:ATP-dependent DNA ligase
MIQLASDSGNADALVLFLFDLLYLDGADLLPRPHRQDHRRRTIGPATEKLPRARHVVSAQGSTSSERH